MAHIRDPGQDGLPRPSWAPDKETAIDRAAEEFGIDKTRRFRLVADAKVAPMAWITLRPSHALPMRLERRG